MGCYYISIGRVFSIHSLINRWVFCFR